jgi:hypothetical protein
MTSLIQRYQKTINGVLSCWDRVIIQGTLPGICYAAGMTAYLSSHNIRIFDYARFAEPLRDIIRLNAQGIAKENGLEIKWFRGSSERKDQYVKNILSKRGLKPGLVCILSTMERCPSYYPWYDKSAKKAYLKPKDRQCVHYYFYFIDENFGLCYLRVPTWCPFRLQFYFNGHNWLAMQLKRKGIGYKQLENSFIHIENWEKAQKIVRQFSTRQLHKALDRFAQKYCPVIRRLRLTYHWSIMQAEYATDVVFAGQRDLSALYEAIVRTAIHAVKPGHVATFLGRKLTGAYRDVIGNDFNTRIEGTRIRHYMGPVSIKMYDKFSRILRIETTTNNLSFFKHHRWVEQRDGKKVYKLAPLKKSIYSMYDLSSLMYAANYRYIDFISALDIPSVTESHLFTVSEKKLNNHRRYMGFNFFSAQDQRLFEILTRGEFNISGLRNADLRQHLPEFSPNRMSRLLKRLRVHGLIKKIGKSYKYYVTKYGKRVIIAGLKLKQQLILPAIANG